MSVEFFVTVLIVFATIVASVILLKFWMDFKLCVWDRENQINDIVEHSVRNRVKNKFLDRKLRNKLYNKKQSEDIIIDCEVEIINKEKSKEFVCVQKERLLK